MSDGTQRRNHATSLTMSAGGEWRNRANFPEDGW